MKRKLFLLAVMVIAIVSMLAISASAATIYKTADGTTLFSYVDEDADYDFDSYEGSFPKVDDEGNALTWYITATATENDDTVHTVASLKTLGEAGSINGNGAYSFTSPVTNKNTVSVNFPDNAGIKSFGFNTFGGHSTRANNNILFVYCPNTITAFANNPFQETNVIVVELDSETPITQIPQNFAHEARNLETINIPASVTVINGSSGQIGAPFYNNYSLVSVTFASNNTVTEMKSSCFQNCKSLTSINLPDTVTKMGAYCFASCTSLEEIKLPNALVSVSDHFFSWCSSLKVIRMGASFVYFANTGDNSFTYSTGKVEEFYIPSTFYATAPDTELGYQVSYAFQGASANCKFFYCGTIEDFNKAKENFLTQKSATSNNGSFLNAAVITYEEYLKNPDSYATGRYVICEYSSCDAFYESNHIGEQKLLFTGEALLSSANVCTVCTRCERTEITDTKGALFTNKGYSKNDNGAIMQGFAINKELVSFYSEWLGEINYGLVAGVYSYTDGEETKYLHETGELLSLTEGNLVAADKVATVAFDKKTEYDAFEMKISGLTDSLASTKVFCCAYVVYGDTIYYISDKKVTTGNAGTAISIGEIQ